MTDYPLILRSRFRNSNLPLPYAGVYLQDVSEELSKQTPAGAVQKFVERMSSGRVLRAQGHPRTCGVGMWIGGRSSRLLAAAVMSQLLLDQVIESAYYLDAYEYAESKKPDSAHDYDQRMGYDLVVLSGASRITDWGKGLIYQLTRERYWRGLPTIIADDGTLLESREMVFPESMFSVFLKES